RPVQLVQVDTVDAQARQAGVAFREDLALARRALGGVAVRAEAELREPQRAPGRRHLPQGAADDGLRWARAVDRSGVDPVDAPIDGRVNRVHAGLIILTAPL